MEGEERGGGRNASGERAAKEAGKKEWKVGERQEKKDRNGKKGSGNEKFRVKGGREGEARVANEGVRRDWRDWKPPSHPSVINNMYIHTLLYNDDV